ncbi:MAG: hypothetical protein GF383_03695 [Candidatus Lokiarchaeota archaeon]|nr:hypothetical protein [Candidatus Lokiarchaeota archaeon]MBD3338798.1 hypothetical protein [Candidatus Lokiarchaeota archaeon]
MVEKKKNEKHFLEIRKKLEERNLLDEFISDYEREIIDNLWEILGTDLYEYIKDMYDEVIDKRVKEFIYDELIWDEFEYIVMETFSEETDEAIKSIIKNLEDEYRSKNEEADAILEVYDEEVIEFLKSNYGENVEQYIREEFIEDIEDFIYDFVHYKLIDFISKDLIADFPDEADEAIVKVIEEKENEIVKFYLT